MKNYSPKILITGCHGQLGSALCQHKLAASFRIIALARDVLDITDSHSIQETLTHYKPDFVINTAAYTAVDKAETEKEQAQLVNYMGAKNLGMACEQNKIPLIHISTDYVFNGNANSPYHEDDATHPINYYGESKWLGEQAIRQQCEKHVILRVSGVFSEYGNNFLKTMLRLGRERQKLKIVNDQITCPTYAGHIADVIYSMIDKGLSKSGTYHYCDLLSTSWFQFASSILHTAKQQQTLMVEQVTPITTAEYPTAAKRPAYSVLDCNKIARDYEIMQANWIDAVQLVVEKLK